MTNIETLKLEMHIALTDVTATDIRKCIDYLHSRGYLGGVPEWQPIETAPKDGGIKYTRAQPKYKRVDLDTLYKNTCNCEGDGDPCMSCAHDFGCNETIDDIKYKYGDLYTIQSANKE